MEVDEVSQWGLREIAREGTLTQLQRMRGCPSGTAGRRGSEIDGVAREEYRGRKEEPGMGPRGQGW